MPYGRRMVHVRRDFTARRNRTGDCFAEPRSCAHVTLSGAAIPLRRQRQGTTRSDVLAHSGVHSALTSGFLAVLAGWGHLACRRSCACMYYFTKTSTEDAGSARPYRYPLDGENNGDDKLLASNPLTLCQSPHAAASVFLPSSQKLNITPKHKTAVIPPKKATTRYRANRTR